MSKLKRPIVAGLVLLAVYGVASLFMNPGGYLGTDTGAKVATLEVMEARHTARPVLGYWAERWDPAGDLHPIYDAQKIDGDWVHVTTLPMLELARPLYSRGGYRLALLLPMLGALAAAFAARSLARRAAGDGAGWLAYWVVGLLSPLAVYALDFWEHALGMGLVVGAVALLAGVVEGQSVVGRSLGAGALLGAAATMRTESFVYGFVAVGLCCAVLLARRKNPWPSLTCGVLSVAGFAVPWFANRVLESALGGNSRGSRVAGTASGGFDRLGDRAREVAVTMLALRPARLNEVLVVGGALAIVLALAVSASRRAQGARVVVVLLGLALALHLSALAGGLGFVPGMIAAAPLVVVGVMSCPVNAGSRYTLGVALLALPLVWGFQLLGGASPQWAGRYALPSCILLVTLGAAALVSVSRELRWGMLALSVLVTLSGVAWLGERSHGFERLFDELVQRPEDVVVSRNGFFVREGGAAYSERLWLSAVTPADLRRAAKVVGDSGHDSFAVIDESESAPAAIGGARLSGTDETSVVGVPLYLHSYRTPATP